MFLNRNEAGKKLTLLLSSYKKKPDTLVLGLARGGVVLAYEIAKALSLPFNLVIPRKIALPIYPELALGAVSEEGEVLLNDELIDGIGASATEIQHAVEVGKKEILERSKRYRKVAPLENVKGKTIILVDDGVATGFTMLAEIQSLKVKKVKKIVAASPVASTRAWKMIQKMSDEAICLEVTDDFSGISQFYADFSQVDDAMVLSILQQRFIKQ